MVGVSAARSSTPVVCSIGTCGTHSAQRSVALSAESAHWEEVGTLWALYRYEGAEEDKGREAEETKEEG